MIFQGLWNVVVDTGVGMQTTVALRFTRSLREDGAASETFCRSSRHRLQLMSERLGFHPPVEGMDQRNNLVVSLQQMLLTRKYDNGVLLGYDGNSLRSWSRLNGNETSVLEQKISILIMENMPLMLP